MNAKAFLDTNIFVYSYSASEPRKKDIADELYVQYHCYSSVQALNEFCNVCAKKWGLARPEIEHSITEIMSVCQIGMVSVNTIFSALRLQFKYGYSFYDSMMLASALEYGCEYFISEDLSAGQVIEKKLIIINPFI
ncbi:MAG: PIN domain-containing protein [Firmicutes bacterium]|nr:PIN domain-containing protein [Bacillota bacterium]